MKILILCISLMVLTSCFRKTFTNPTMKVGDCYEWGKNESLERWEKQKYFVSKVLEVGKHSYRVLYISSDALGADEVRFAEGSDSFYTVHDENKLKHCPIEFSGMQ